jgi:hypothetical protein
MSIIEIDVTNVCGRSCSNCTRLVGHYSKDKLFFMEPAYYEKAVKSLVDFPGVVGMIGGEPMLHPQFMELCGILMKHIPQRWRRAIFTNPLNTGDVFGRRKSFLDRVFGLQNLNRHIDTPVVHTPILVGAGEFFGEDTKTMWEYMDKCWIQMTWSATINPKGAYFCEVAGVLAMLLDGPDGWDIEARPEWWRKRLPEYEAQKQWGCTHCGAAIPLKPRRSTEGIDDISPSYVEKLKALGSPKVAAGKYEVFCGKLDPTQVRNCTWYWYGK